MGVVGIALAYLFYMAKPQLPALFKGLFRPLYGLFFNKWFFDEIYDFIFVKNTFRFGRLFWRMDQKIVDRFGPDGVSSVSKFFARQASRFQSGYIFQYAFVMMIAVIGLISWFFFKESHGLFGLIGGAF